MKQVLLVFSAMMIAAPVASIHAQTVANSLSFGGKAIAIDMTSCSPENSADGKSRAIVAADSASGSSATLQFSSLTPPAGTYATVADEDGLGEGKVIVAVGGRSFGGVFMAVPGQSVTVTRAGPRYAASFAGLTLIDMMSKAPARQTVAGSFGCQ